MRFVVPWLAYACLIAAEDPGLRPAPVDDPIGLGERLALIDYLRDEHGQEVAAGTSLAELRRRYWAIQAAANGPSDEERMTAVATERLRDEIVRRFHVEVDPNLDIAGLQALKQQLIDQSMEEVAAMAAAEQAETVSGLTSPEAVITRARESVVMIGTATASGSGFFIDQHGTLLTNRHVCPTVGEVVWVFWDPSQRREPERFRVTEVSSGRDCAMLRPLAATGRYQSLPRRRTAVNLADEVIAVGYPLGTTVAQALHTDPFDISLQSGTITSFRSRDQQVEWIMSDCPISQGNSGGPLIVKATGEVVGIVTGVIDPHDHGARGAMMVFSIPVDQAFTDLGLRY